MSDRVAPQLLDWYDRNARSLPWRMPPGHAARPDPYRVWLSEIMLQQTTVSAVRPYFQTFTGRWPTVEALAAAPEDEVMAAWAGLGYYSRARNLVKCARQVVEMGGLPDSEAALRELPGVGEYTAAAIAAIAFGQRAVVVDANVERVVARLFAVRDPLPGARAQIRAFAGAITPAERAGDFAQAMMDLGAQICTARDAKCLLCPLSSECRGRQEGDPVLLPKREPKKARAQRRGTAFWIEKDGPDGKHVWLVTRPDKGMLGGMRALPDDGWNARNDGAGDAPLPGAWRAGGLVRHVFTHCELELGVAIYAGETFEALDGGEWWPLDRLDEAGLPSLYARAAMAAIGQGG